MMFGKWVCRIISYYEANVITLTITDILEILPELSLENCSASLGKILIHLNIDLYLQAFSIPLLTQYPRYYISVYPRWHLHRLTVSPAFHNGPTDGPTR